MKTCKKCNIEKPLLDYYKIKGGKFGVVARCKPCYLQDNKQWADSHRELRNLLAQQYRAKHPELHRQRVRSWRERNKAFDAMRQRERNAIKKQAMPIWANRENIKMIYENCPPGYHVDHEIPLRGKTVSGLHVEFNLQYLPAVENLRKRNLYANNVV